MLGTIHYSCFPPLSYLLKNHPVMGQNFLGGQPLIDDQGQRSGSHKFSRVKHPSGKAICFQVENWEEKRGRGWGKKTGAEEEKKMRRIDPSVSSSHHLSFGVSSVHCHPPQLLLHSDTDKDHTDLLITLNTFFHLIKLNWECEIFWNDDNPTKRSFPDIRCVHEVACFWLWCPPFPYLLGNTDITGHLSVMQILCH